MATPVFFNPDKFPAAQRYYTMFRVEPIYNGATVSIGRHQPIRKMTFEDILKIVLRSYSASKNILVLSHGSKDGLALPWQKRSATGLMSQSMDYLIKNLNGQISDDEAISRLGFDSGPDFRGFKGNLEKVQKLKLGHVIFRSCDTGANANTLQKLKTIIGCSIVSAPKVPTSYGIIDYKSPNTNDVSWRNFQRDNPKAVIEGVKPNRFGYASKQISRTELEISARTDTHAAAKQWVGKNMVKGSYQSGLIPFQAMIDASKSNATIFSGQRDFINYLARS